MKNELKIFKRNCPSCGKELIYKHSSNFYNARKKESSCINCSRLGERNPMYGNGYKISGEKNGWYGRQHTEEIRKKHSKSLSQKYKGTNNPFYGKSHTTSTKNIIGRKNSKYERTDEMKKNIRLGIINYRKQNGLVGFVPNYNPSSIPIIEQKAEELGITDLQHAENGGEFFVEALGYWVDGFSKEKNIVIEYYENSHQYQKERDLKRQKEITNLLNCKFIILKK